MKKHLRIVIPAGNGQVGGVLSRHFHVLGHEVVVLARKPIPAPWRVVSWDGETLGDWTSELENSDVVINLAGRSVNCRYTAENRKAMMDSRTETFSELDDEEIVKIETAIRQAAETFQTAEFNVQVASPSTMFL
jgi:NAD dependent epimerase/dehydratase family enzyme